jgi:hypothetical protein
MFFSEAQKRKGQKMTDCKKSKPMFWFKIQQEQEEQDDRIEGYENKE